MAYHIDTANVLLALGYQPFDDFNAGTTDGVNVTLQWSHVDPQPTEQAISDYATDTTNLPSGETFSQWVTTHGGDAVATAKRIARELQDADDAQNRIVRAVVKLMVDEINDLRQWIVDYKGHVAAAISLADLKARVALMPNLPQRTYPIAKTAINNLIDGE